ncbi:VolA/Pla-1 family phospholipase [Paraglaciecola sp.]|uniref:VolA/Pla-1 family phospholipase n=1 Tax=Paraglaciecola sp. TaxID=1920173 RepID=UPI003EF7FD6D
MRKLLSGIGICFVFGLNGCGGSDSNKSNPIFEEPQVPIADEPYIRVVFNPATSDLNIPNDLLMLPSGNFFDFTLNTEGDEPFDLTNPKHALSALDGWSLHQPMEIRVDLPDGMDIDPSTVTSQSIVLFEAKQALEGESALCLSTAAQLPAPGVPCELGQQLVYGEDFIASYTPGSASVNVVPLKVLKPSQGYLLVVTESLKDQTGRPVKGSGTWDLVRQSIETNKVGVEALVPLQTITNLMVELLEPEDIAREELSYAAYFSTQSIGHVLTNIKKLNIGSYAEAFKQANLQGLDAESAQLFAKQYLPTIKVEALSENSNAFESLASRILAPDELEQLTQVGLNTCAGLLNTINQPDSPLYEVATQTFNSVGAFCAAEVVGGTVDLPYYSNPIQPKTDWWKAACTSGATLKLLGADVITGLIQAGQVGGNNTLCQQASNNQLFDLDLTSLGMDDPRNLTKYNSIPMLQGRQNDNPDTLFNEAGTESIKVLFTVPNESVLSVISAASGGAVPLIQKPASGWPVVIFSHGITGNKSNVLPLTAAFSLAGFATVAIDHPLHGERGLLDQKGAFTNASVNSVTDYLNFTSLLTARDNVRQSMSDIMNLRLALNSINDGANKLALDISEVHFIAQSLGSVTGVGAVATANSSMGGELALFDELYSINTSVLNVPSGGVPTSVLESNSFGSLVKGSLLAASSDDFVAFLTQYSINNGLSGEEAIGPAAKAFLEALSEDQLQPINKMFDAFRFASQTVLDGGDPIAFAKTLTNTTPVLMQLHVGGGINDDGSVAITDDVNPVETKFPLVGSQALANIMGLEQVHSTGNQSRALIRMLTGDHFSLLVPTASSDTTTEVQQQATSFFLSKGQTVVISDTSLVEN